MRRTVQLAVLGAIFMVVAPGLAPAEEGGSSTYARTGPYLGIAFAYGIENFDLSDVEDAFDTDIGTSDSLGLDVRAGYRLHPNFAVEGNFQYFDEFRFDVSGLDIAEGEAWSFTGNAKGYLLTDRFQPYGILGIGVLQAELGDTIGIGLSEEQAAFMARFGGGLDCYATENVIFNAEFSYVLPAGDLDAFQFIPLVFGIQYRF
jgi:opacity protein-like surface antigen